VNKIAASRGVQDIFNGEEIATDISYAATKSFGKCACVLEFSLIVTTLIAALPFPDDTLHST